MNIKEILIMIIIFSFVGFIFENMWMIYEYSRIENKIPMFIVVFITIIILIDMSVSYIKMYNNGRNRIWRIDLKK